VRRDGKKSRQRFLSVIVKFHFKRLIIRIEQIFSKYVIL
jgi:hypothetical protein